MFSVNFFMNMKWIVTILIAAMAFSLGGCSSTPTKSKKELPSRATEGGDLPWGKPASWEGGLPGMGGVGTPNRY